jgi:hypothetical protein
MPKIYTYKKQGNGKDSWTVSGTDDEGNEILPYMTLDNPDNPKKDKDATRRIDLVELFKSLKPAERKEFKQLLNNLLNSNEKP